MRKILPALFLLYAVAPLWGDGISAHRDEKARAKKPSATLEKVRGEIVTRWKEMGGARSPLGSPVGEVEEAIGGGFQRTFRNGIISWSPESGINVTVLEGVTFAENQLTLAEGLVLTRTSEDTFLIQGARQELPRRRAPESPAREGRFSCGCSNDRIGIGCMVTIENNTLSCMGGCNCRLKVTITAR